MLERRLARFAIAAAPAVFAVCVIVIAGGGMRRPDNKIAQPGSLAPEIALRDVNDHDLKLSGLRGSFVLVYFTPDSLAAMKPAQTLEANDVQHTPSANAAFDAKLNQLNQLSDALNAKRVTVLEGDLSPSEQPMNLLGVSVKSTVDDSSRYGRMLLDSDGEIARNYRVDAIAAQPTLFVIDDRGVIRFRGSFEEVSAGNLMHKLAPVTAAKQFSAALTGTELTPLATLNHF